MVWLFTRHLVAFSIPSVFPIIAWYFISDHSLVYINFKYVSYLSLLAKVFRCNLYLSKFIIRYLYYIFFNPLYDFFKWTYQIAKNNHLIVTRLRTFSLLIFPQHSLLVFLILWHAPVPIWKRMSSPSYP